jgi:hypothetical protein
MVTNGFAVRVYGTLNQQPPYVADADGNLGALNAGYTTAQAQVANFPAVSGGLNFWAIQPGVKINGVYCYGAIEVPASGLQVHSTKYVAQQTPTQLATLRNA